MTSSNSSKKDFYDQSNIWSESDLDFFELCAILWQGRILIIAITVISAIGSVIYALEQTEIYRSEALLAPTESEQIDNNSILGGLGGLGGVASLVGFDIGNQGSNQLTTTLAILKSREFIVNFIENHDLLVTLMGSKWDKEVGSTVIDPEIYDSANQKWIEDEPTMGQAFSLFNSIFILATDDDTGLITIAIEWYDPVVAKKWVDWIIEDINALIKARDLSEANNSIIYLQKQLQETQLVEIQRVFNQMIETQLRTVMLADVREEYILRVIDPPVIAEEKIRPRRSFIAIVGTLIGGSLSLILVLLRYAFKTNKGKKIA